MTADELLHLPLPGRQAELIRGRLVVREPPGTWHGALAARLSARLSVFVERLGLGAVFSQDTGFKIASAKVADWLEAGTALVWVIGPAGRVARVYRSDGSESAMSDQGALDGEDVLPGFACRLDELLRR
jgi:Uma2 family endonuclease